MYKTEFCLNFYTDVRNNDLAKTYTEVTNSLFNAPVVLQKQGELKVLKLWATLNDPIAGITGNTKYTLCTLPEAYRPASAVVCNAVCGRYVNSNTSVADYAYIRIDTNGELSITPFNDIKTHVFAIYIPYF